VKTPYPYAENRAPQSLSPHTPYPQQFLCMSEETEEKKNKKMKRKRRKRGNRTSLTFIL